MIIEKSLHLCFVIPFVGMLLSIALAPLLIPEFWHRNYLKVSLGWTGLVLAMMVSGLGLSLTTQTFFHMLLHEYIPFILMVGALFTITGGIHMVIRARAGALANTLYLFMGGIVASLIGTTGAAMLLIRPFIDMNKNRSYRTHLGVFFIFIVANIGGCLTPLGDPPLFLGFLQGVPFDWPFKNLFFPFLGTISILLCVFFVIDFILMARDKKRADYQVPTHREPGQSWIHLTGTINIGLLIMVVLLVWLSGVWKESPKIAFLDMTMSELLRNGGLLGLMFLSLKVTPGTVRHYNHFTWEPFKEVAELFIGIFATLIPVTIMLQQGKNGAFSGLIDLVNPGGHPHNELYFWLTGGLSGVLDNAPTYLVFYNMIQTIAGGSVTDVLLHYPHTLMAISMGAVFMGALTYIGNAPNFMVRSIVEKRHVHMPSFFGYMVWSGLILLPIFFVVGRVLF